MKGVATFIRATLCDSTSPQGSLATSVLLTNVRLRLRHGDATGGFLSGCTIACSAATSNCRLCYANNPPPFMTTDTPEACQALCAKNPSCGEFQWVADGSNATGSLKHHECVFHCKGTNNPGKMYDNSVFYLIHSRVFLQCYVREDSVVSRSPSFRSSIRSS